MSIVNSRRAALVNLRANPAALMISGTAMETLPPSSRVAAWRWKVWRLMGDEAIAIIRFDEGRAKSEIELAKRLFPEADVSEKLIDIPIGVPPPRNGSPINATPRR